MANLQNSDDDAPILSEEIQLTLMPESEDLSNETLLLEVQQVIPFVTDACSFSINGLIPNTFNCADLGEQSFEFTAIDANGNEAFLDGKVMIVDTLSPILSCPSDTTIAIRSNPLIYSIQAEDWCSVELELAEGLPSGSTFPQGTTLVTYEAEDESGNTNSCSLEVEVIPGPEIVIETINSSCYQANDGYINVSVNSSTAYVLNWTGGLSGLENFDLSPGVYTLEVLDENGCSSTQTITLEEWPEIQIVVDSIFEDDGDNGGGIQISVLSDPTNYVYAWSDAEGNLLSTQADSLMGLSSGMYSLLVTDTLSMCDQTVSFTIQQGVTGLEEIKENAIGIYPNPTSDYLILSGIKNQSFPMQWSVFDRSGQVQLSGLYRGLLLDVQTLPPGVYYLSFKVSSSLHTYSFVIMR